MDKAMYNGSYRKKTGSSLRAYAKEVGVTHATVARWEKGQAEPSNLAIQKLLALTAKSQAPKVMQINYAGITCSPPIRVEPDSGLYAAYCDPLGIADCGRTPDEATKALKTSVQVFFKALDKRGLLERRLESKGIEYTKVKDLLELTKKLSGK